MTSPKYVYGFRYHFSFLSNFFPCDVVYKGREFKCSEAAFQSEKALDITVRNSFQKLDGRKAKKLGKSINLRPDWKEIKEQVMLEVLRAKFKKGSTLAKNLVNTGNLILIEDSPWGDVYWGMCHGRGKNRLGELLMKVRDELKEG